MYIILPISLGIIPFIFLFYYLFKYESQEFEGNDEERQPLIKTPEIENINNNEEVTKVIQSILDIIEKNDQSNEYILVKPDDY
jgi:hypothetical protein